MAIELISKIKPKNNGEFPLVDAADVEMPDGTRLDAATNDLKNQQAEQGEMAAATAQRVEELGDELNEAKNAFNEALSKLDVSMPVLPGVTGQALEPETFYQFGEVSELAVTLAQKEDGKAHEYWFQFQPQEGFSGLTIAPEVRWVGDPQYPAGQTCLVGICMGMAVMAVG